MYLHIFVSKYIQSIEAWSVTNSEHCNGSQRDNILTLKVLVTTIDALGHF